MEIFIKLFLIVSLLIEIRNCQKISEECLVTDNLQHSIYSGNEFGWIAFLSRPNEMSISVAFKERYEGKDSDDIIFISNELHREKRRNYKSLERKEINASTFLQLGWNNFSMEVESNNMSLNINSHTIDLDFEYPISHLSIVSENLASCSSNKPAWKITEGKESAIPLDGIDFVRQFTLSSDKPFSPIIFMNDHKFPLNFDSGVKIGYSNKTLPSGSYEFRLSKAKYKWNLQIKNETGYEELLTMKTTDDLTTMTVRSLKNDFLLELTPTRYMKNSSNNMDHSPSTITVLVLLCYIILIQLVITIFIICLFKQKIGRIRKKILEGNQYMSTKKSKVDNAWKSP